MYHNTIYVLFVMHVLFILAACNQYQAKKEKRARRTVAHTEHALDIKNEVLAESFEISEEDYPLPSCLTQPYFSPDERYSHLENWRGEAEQIKGRIFSQIHAVGLTKDFAVQLALINNPNLLAYYENLEIGYADLLEAGLRRNPVFRTKIRFPQDPEEPEPEEPEPEPMPEEPEPEEPIEEAEEEYETTFNFLDFFLIPFRENAALAELQVIESEFGQMVLDLTKEVKINWVLVKTLNLELDREIQRIELKKLAFELAELQRQAGNVGKGTVRNFKIEYELAKNKQRTLLADLESAREKLNRSLGLFGPEICFPLAGELEWRNDAAPPLLFNLEQAAINNRLDIEAIRRKINALAQKEKLKDPWTYANLLVGESFKKSPDGSTLFGPKIDLEVPIFNSGQAAREKSHALIAKAQKELVAKAVEACSEVREYLNTMNIYRSELADLEEKILPDFAEQIAADTIKHNVMAFSIFDLFVLKSRELSATIDHIHALRHYLTAKIELLHAIGGDFEIFGGIK